MYRPQALDGTDAGLVAIGARFGLAAGLGLGAGADGALDGIMGSRNDMWADTVRQVPIVATSLGGSGTIMQPATLGPPTGWYWGVRRLTAQGFSAGTVTVYDTSASGEPLETFAAAGTQTFGKGQILLHPGHYLVFVAAGITGTVTMYGAADLFRAPFLSRYLG